MYGRVVLYYHSQKDDMYCNHLTVGVNLIKYQRTEDLATAKLLVDITISTPEFRFMCCDIK